MRNISCLAALVASLMLAPVSSGIAAGTKPHRLVIQVDQNEHGKERGPCDPGAVGSCRRAVGRRAPDGVAGSGVELSPAMTLRRPAGWRMKLEHDPSDRQDLTVS